MFSGHDNCGMRMLNNFRFWRGVLFTALAFGVYTMLVIPFVNGITTPDTIILTPSEYAARADAEPETPTGNEVDQQKYITVKLLGLIPIKKVMVDILPFDTILVGGMPIGIYGEIDGVLVTTDTSDHVLQKGDLIKSVDDTIVRSCVDFSKAIQNKKQIDITLVRNGTTLKRHVVLDNDIELRDTTTGVGMLTFINPENNQFSALGHQMADFETGTAVDLHGGEIRSVNTYGIIKTSGKQTGVLQSSVRANTTSQGSITNGTNFGITGCLTPDSEILDSATTTMPVATRYNVHPGKATLRTSINGSTIEEFDCEILKTRYQERRRNKSMVIRITDPRLLEATGGIIHGMSGSPIIQDGHLVGALTHALTHDPAKGYALYIDFIAH
ncbi:MAG: hypothetical protein MJ054_00090 [Clostridia bacterium]|nr:hypothetical protein [Clostridia bacterium]